MQRLTSRERAGVRFLALATATMIALLVAAAALAREPRPFRTDASASFGSAQLVSADNAGQDNPINHDDASAAVLVQVGPEVLHVPKAYIDGSDGFQGKFGYLKIKAELPCLTPLTVEDPGIRGKGWGSVLHAQLSMLDPHQKMGEELLRIYLKHDETSGANFPNKDEKQDQALVAGTGFAMNDSHLLMLDLFSYGSGANLFLLLCDRHSVVPSPSCSSRSRVNGKLFVEYRYGRSHIDNGIDGSILIDARVHQLFDRFLSGKVEGLSSTGVCK